MDSSFQNPVMFYCSHLWVDRTLSKKFLVFTVNICFKKAKCLWMTLCSYAMGLKLLQIEERNIPN